jgi:hypothetical protein
VVVPDSRAGRNVYRRRRLVALVSAMVLLAVAVAAAVTVAGRLGGGGAPTAPAAPTAIASPVPRSATYVVKPGDTVWSVARRMQPDGDIRPLVDEIVARNGSAALVVGQLLTLPIRD